MESQYSIIPIAERSGAKFHPSFLMKYSYDSVDKSSEPTQNSEEHNDEIILEHFLSVELSEELSHSDPPSSSPMMNFPNLLPEEVEISKTRLFRERIL